MGEQPRGWLSEQGRQTQEIIVEFRYFTLKAEKGPGMDAGA
jgi:hypothetical protein